MTASNQEVIGGGGRFGLREPLNGLTHCFGAVLAVAATVALVLRATGPLVPERLTTFLIFGCGAFLLYLASTLYHWLPLSEAGLRLWKRIDHSMIFIYIAATYTPISVIALRGPIGWTLLAVIWGLALAGVIVKLLWLHAPRKLSTTLYVGMGWVALGVLYPLVQNISLAGVLWLVGGGVLYTIGAIIYALKKPNLGVFGFHEIFHLFVIAGSACHFWVIFHYIGGL